MLQGEVTLARQEQSCAEATQHEGGEAVEVDFGTEIPRADRLRAQDNCQDGVETPFHDQMVGYKDTTLSKAQLAGEDHDQNRSGKKHGFRLTSRPLQNACCTFCSVTSIGLRAPLHILKAT